MEKDQGKVGIKHNPHWRKRQKKKVRKDDFCYHLVYLITGYDGLLEGHVTSITAFGAWLKTAALIHKCAFLYLLLSSLLLFYSSLNVQSVLFSIFIRYSWRPETRPTLFRLPDHTWGWTRRFAEWEETKESAAFAFPSGTKDQVLFLLL